MESSSLQRRFHCCALSTIAGTSSCSLFVSQKLISIVSPAGRRVPLTAVSSSSVRIAASTFFFFGRAAGSVLDLLDANDTELRHLSLAILANLLAFSDSPLLSREECACAVRDHLDSVLLAIPKCDVSSSASRVYVEIGNTWRQFEGADLRSCMADIKGAFSVADDC